jgi:SpoVK/Ycf46/Vps4 family AAA+-type ATPase
MCDAAMHPGSLPAAMLRSGRVELWLETMLPDAGARAAILRDRLKDLPALLGVAVVEKLAGVSQGLTGADLRNVVEDAKLLCASDRVHGKPALAVEQHFQQVIETVRSNRRKYARNRSPKLAESPDFGFHVG